jgi:uncharacterized protein (TIGR02099 family)
MRCAKRECGANRGRVIILVCKFIPNDVLSLSPALLKTWSGLTRWLLWSVALVWLLFGMVWGAVHWLIVPRIGEFRPQLEARASEALGIPVRVGVVAARSSGLMPSLELTDVALFDPQGRVALRLPRVLVTVSPRSLWRLGFDQLYIDQPKLDIRRSSDGRISVAGLDLTGSPGADTGALDWLFSQIELVIHDGAVRWTDELRPVDPVVLQQVDIVLRNLGRHHDLRLDATPPPGWGQRLSVQGRFLQPLLSRQNGQWRTWEGQVFVDLKQVDLFELGRYVDPGFVLSEGRGALRAWLEVNRGKIMGATADVALSKVTATLGAGLPALALQQLQGRLRGRVLERGFELSTESLAFDTPDGLHWPGGNVRLKHEEARGRDLARTELQADQLDLSALAQIAHSLPLQAGLSEQLARYAPKGRVDTLMASWSGDVSAPDKYMARGRLSQFALDAVNAAPGVRGLDVDFELNQQAGTAKLAIRHGSIDVPAVFQEGVIPVDQLSANARWQQSGEDMSFELTEIKFANADAQGDATIKWQTSDPKKSPSRSRFPGLLDLQANLSRADGRRVHRYLPLVIDSQARDYVREAVQDGSASNVKFVVKGDIYDIPATAPHQGIFKISADVKDARVAYVPTSLQPAGDLPWPALNKISGELLFDGLQLKVKNARAQLGDDSAIQATKVNVVIADLTHTEVKVDADLKGSLPAMLRLVNQSPVTNLLDQALSGAVTTGSADYKLALALPIADLSKSTVQGSVILAGNDVQIAHETPKITRARGVVNFNHNGFSLAGVQVRALGGEARLDGGLVFTDPDNPNPAVIRVSGNASAEGLRQTPELGLVSLLARQASGSAAYSAALGLRRGVLELLVSSNLQGMAARLPAPLNKPAQSLLPLRYQTALLPPEAGMRTANTSPVHDRLSLSLGGLTSMVFDRDMAGTEPKILRGAIGIGADTQDSVVLPTQGVNINLNLPKFDVDAWTQVLTQLDTSAAPVGATTSISNFRAALLPTHLAVRCDSLTFGGRQYNRLVLGATREGTLWRANVDATELNGYLEYRQPSNGNGDGGAGRVHARLARLTLAPSTASEVEALFDSQPANVPALDIVVDDFELRGKRLGRLEVDAVNRTAQGVADTPEWRLNKLNLTVPEATLRASGNWVRLGALDAPASNASNPAPPARRRSVMNFKLDIADGGGLLGRLGMKDVVRRASGKMEGQVAWVGSPLSIDYPTLSGAFTVNVTAGQFLKADPGIAKLLGVLSLQALPRRLTLDFRDVFSEGFAFDFLRGDITVDKGLAHTNNLQMKGVNAVVLMEGAANIAKETQNLTVVVIPEINAGTAALIATVINPAVGLGTFLAQLFLRRPLTESVTQEFLVDGSWADPQVTKVAKPTKSVTPTPSISETPL